MASTIYYISGWLLLKAVVDSGRSVSTAAVPKKWIPLLMSWAVNNSITLDKAVNLKLPCQCVQGADKLRTGNKFASEPMYRAVSFVEKTVAGVLKTNLVVEQLPDVFEHIRDALRTSAPFTSLVLKSLARIPDSYGEQLKKERKSIDSIKFIKGYILDKYFKMRAKDYVQHYMARLPNDPTSQVSFRGLVANKVRSKLGSNQTNQTDGANSITGLLTDEIAGLLGDGESDSGSDEDGDDVAEEEEPIGDH